jgi:hypothetical protein
MLAVELRRSAAPGAGVLVLAAGLLLGIGDRGSGTGGWMSLAIGLGFDLILMWPVAMAVGAWQSRREHLASVSELVGTTARHRLLRVLPVSIAMGVAMLGAYAVLTVVMTVVSGVWGTGGYLPTTALAMVALGAVWLVTGVWVGMAVGRLLPYVVTAPALAVVGLGLLIGAQSLPAGVRWLSMVASPAIPLAVQGVHDHDFLTLSGRLNVAHGVLALALAVTAVVLFAAGSRRARAAALLPGLLGAAVAFGIAPRDGAVGLDGVVAGVAVDRVAQELVCTTDTPQVCVARVHAHLLLQLTGPARDALRELSRLTPAPTRAVEDVTPYWVHAPGPDGRADTLTFAVFAGGSDAAAWFTSRTTSFLGTGAWAGCSKPVAPLRAADAWLQGEEPPPTSDEGSPDGAQVHTLWQALRRLPEREALERVSAVRVAALRCAQDLDRVLAPGSGSAG